MLNLLKQLLLVLIYLYKKKINLWKMEQRYSKRRIDMLNNPLEGFAGKDSIQLGNYYDPVNAFHKHSTNAKG